MAKLAVVSVDHPKSLSAKTVGVPEWCSVLLLLLAVTTIASVVVLFKNNNSDYDSVRRRTDDTHYPAGWKHLTVEIAESNLEKVTIINEDTVLLKFSHCPIFEAEILDEAEMSLDGSCACKNATDLTSKPPTKHIRKIREIDCTMWQKVKPVFLEKLKKAEEELGTKAHVPVYHRDEKYVDFEYNNTITISVWSVLGCLLILTFLLCHINRAKIRASQRYSSTPTTA